MPPDPRGASAGEPAAPPPPARAPAALALTSTADVVATVSIACLACVRSGRLAAALLLRTPDPLVNAAGSLLDILLAALLRAGLALCQSSSSSACSGVGAAAAAGAAHAALAAWLAAKGALALRLTGGRAAGQFLDGGDVVMSVPGLLAAEALGILFSG